MTRHGVRSTTAVTHRLFMGMVAVFLTLGMLTLAGLAGTQVASAAATAPAATQCDPPAFPTGAGFQVTCTLSIDNTVTAGVNTSTVTATDCLAAAGVLAPFGCTTTVTSSNQLVTSVDQCNGIVFGGGSNVICNVSVVNTIPTGTATPGVTVNQCIGSGTGGGTQPTVVCAPVASTTNATVTQCNGSGNGGGASTRVQCDVTGGTTAEPVTINQCNGSANGGGSTVICTTTFANNFVAASPTTTTTTTVPATPGPTTPGPTTPGPTTPGPTTPATPAAGGGTPATPTAGGTPGAAGAVGVTPVGSGVASATGASPGAGGPTGTLATAAPTPQGTLAFTGANVAALLLAALMAIALGAVAIVWSRRGKRSDRTKVAV